MRTCLLLPLAALLATVASAGFLTLPELEGPAKILKSSAPQRRGFNAQDSSVTNETCSVPFLTAQAVVDFKCPYINSWLKKTIQDDDMMKKACNDGCSDLVVATYSTFTSCFATTYTDAPKVLTKLRDCKLRARCNSVNALAQLQSLKNDCINPLTNFSNFSTGVQATIDSVCTNDCLSRAASYAKSYPECLPKDSTSTVSPSDFMNFLGYLCSRPTNTSDRCAWTLRSLSRRSCDDEGACSTPGYWCSHTSFGSCENTWNNTVLREYCSPCMKGLSKFANVLEMDPVFLTGNVDLHCGRVNPSNATSDYCYPIASEAILFAPTSVDDRMCSGDAGLCAPRLLAAFGTVLSATAWQSFKTCMKEAGSTADYCIGVSGLLYYLRRAEQYRQLSDILCATNSKGSFCYPMAFLLRYSGCYAHAQLGDCGTICQTEMPERLANMGCCLPLVNAYLKLQSSTYRAGYLPTGNVTAVGYSGNVTFNFSDTQYADASEPTRAQQPVNAFAVCSNSSALWDQLGSTCAPSSNALSRSIDMPVAYDTVKGNPALFNKMLAAMRSDMIKALGRSCITNDTFQRNQRLKVKTSSSGTSSRRAASTTSDGMTYSFYVDAGAASASVAAAFDTQVSSGALSFTDTASVISTSCSSGCLDSSASLTNIVAAVSDSMASATTLAPGATAAPTTPSPTYYYLPPTSISSDALSRTCAVLAMVLAAALALLQ